MGDDVAAEISTKNDPSKNKKSSFDEKWLAESKSKLLKPLNDKKGANSFMPQMQKQTKKQKTNGVYKLWYILEKWIS